MNNSFTTDFEPSSAAGWKQKIQFELNGADYAATLLTTTNEGITIKPFYHADIFEKVAVPPITSNFRICHSIEITSEEVALTEALNAISLGFNSLKFFAKAPFNIEILLTELLNKHVQFHFHFNFLSETFITELNTFLSCETVFLNIDIIGNLAKTGNWYESLNNDFNSLEAIIKQHPTQVTIGVNVDIYQHAGANAVQQIAYALAHANEYLTKFGGAVATKIQFNFAIGANYFFEISKIRAFRYLFSLICTEYATECNPIIFTTPSIRNKTTNNYTINNLRITTENICGILGGSNTIATAVEFNNSLEQLVALKNDFSTVDIQESTQNNYYIESITKQLAEKALLIFKEIEKGGGFLHQLKEGTIQRKITENAKKEQLQFDSKEIILLGANKITGIIADELRFIKESTSTNSNRKTLIIPIVPKRLSEKLEQKLLKNEA